MASSFNIVFYDDDDWYSLLPLTFIRPSCHMRVGILTILEKWQLRLGSESVGYITKNHLAGKYKLQIGADNILIKSNLLPNENLIKEITGLQKGQSIGTADQVIAMRIAGEVIPDQFTEPIGNHKVIDEADIKILKYPDHLFKLNAHELLMDFTLLTKGRQSQHIDESNQTKNKDQIFVEEGAKIEHSILNANDGPIYIGKNAIVLDGCMLRNGVAICDNSIMKMGSKIYGATTIGPQSKVGGEVKNAVIFGNSNKSHDGYLGNAVIAEWCNLGADTNASNLKNNSKEATQWDYSQRVFRKTGDKLCGLVMGDYTMCGISTMFNTATVVGVSCNLFGAGYHKRFIPSFSWGGPAEYETFRFDKALELAESFVHGKNGMFAEEDKTILSAVLQMEKSIIDGRHSFTDSL